MDTPTAPSTGTATPFELDPEQAAASLKVSLADLSAKATALYVHKNFEEAAELYARAAEMQAEMNGEMSPENAEILFLYGRALFKVGQSKSDVLGGKAPDTKKQAKPKAAKPAKASNGEASSSAGAVAEAETKVGEAAATAAKEAPKDGPKKALFHFEGDENFEDSDEEEQGEEGDEEEEDDDLATAFEILDLARVLLTKKLEAVQAKEAKGQEGKDKEAEPAAAATDGEDTVSQGSPEVRHIKERLADTHDLLAEISLENERYPNAITDSRASLKYKEELYPFESEIIAEAHFKLSLALEFASVTKSEDDDKDQEGTGEVDQTLRDEAADELALAIDSTRLKLQAKEVELATLHNPEDNDYTREEITNVKEVLADMEQRLVDLRKPPLDINQALGLPTRSEQAAAAAASSLPAPVSEEVKKNANDLSGLVRKKRKAEDAPAIVEVEKEAEPEAKRAKSEDLLAAN
ncbi:hypothetical protein QBC35DRAFT_13130 [Podospora australis]|uniref:Tetratricopeptide SHNi-TPR domain-containing protein n=1 Tax=Podospora australis TaxID=1536484 RepID=A0AAN7AJX4_9PEZI|nr:hypothetical protein QBC35DRAFT_13130 [Podospora australis]